MDEAEKSRPADKKDKIEECVCRRREKEQEKQMGRQTKMIKSGNVSAGEEKKSRKNRWAGRQKGKIVGCVCRRNEKRGKMPEVAD